MLRKTAKDPVATLNRLKCVNNVFVTFWQSIAVTGENEAHQLV